jgi:hypothetical protein
MCGETLHGQNVQDVARGFFALHRLFATLLNPFAHIHRIRIQYEVFDSLSVQWEEKVGLYWCRCEENVHLEALTINGTNTCS